MNGFGVTCCNCRRSWILTIETSLYLQLDLSTRPCPYCEAYTLSSSSDDRGSRVLRGEGGRRPENPGQNGE